MDYKQLLWEILNEKECTIDEIKGLDSIYKNIKFYRDKNYRLRFEMTAEFNDYIECTKYFNSDSSENIPGKPIKDYIELTAHCEVPLNKYITNSVLVHNSNSKGKKITLSGELFKLHSYYDFEDYRKEAEFTVFLFLNHDKNFPYSRPLLIDYSSNAQIQIHGFSSNNSILSSGSKSSFNSFVGNIDGAEFAIGYVEKEITNNYYGTYVRFNSVDETNHKYLESIIELFSFITGKSYVPIGHTTFNKLYSPVEKHYVSSFRDDIDNIINKLGYYPIPITISDIHSRRINIENLFSCLLSAYHKYKNEFNLQEVMWYISLSNLVPLDMQMQPLSTALDILKNSWFSSEKSICKGKNLNDDSYKSIISKHIVNLKADIQNDAIINRILRANQIGSNERTTVFLQELGLTTGDVEKIVLRERNKVIHGFSGQRDYQQLHIRTMAYKTLINRIILKILGYNDLYIDYSTYGYPSRKMEEVLGGPYNDQQI